MIRFWGVTSLAGEGRLDGEQEICTGSATFFGLTGKATKKA